MNSRTKLVIGILVLLVIASMAGAVAAKKISGTGDVVLSGTTTKEETPNSVTIEKAVNIKVENGAKVKATEGGPLTGHSTDADQRLQVTLDSKISAEGKTSGTGTAVLNGSVKAQGWFDNTTDDSAVVNTSITSSVALNSGNKGTAEGEVCSSGTASATYNGTELQANVSGSSKASGKVQSASVGILNASGGITSEAMFTPDSYSADSLIYSSIYGENQASGSASAEGNASASTSSIRGFVNANVIGSTEASGCGSGKGQFDANAEISTESQKGLPEWGYVESSIYSNSSVSSGSGTYTGTASSSASTPINEQNTAVYGGTNLEESTLAANTTGTAGTTAQISNSKGMAGSESGIEAYAEAPETMPCELGFGPEFAYLGFEFSPEYADSSIIWSDAWATGFDKNAKVSASGWTDDGKADAMLTYQDLPSGVYTSNTSAEGDTSAKVNVQGCGDAYADSEIGSLDLVGVSEGYFGIYNGLPVGDGVTFQEVPQVPNLPVDPGFGSLGLPDDLGSLFGSDSTVGDTLSQPIGFELPPIDVLEISIISQSVSVHGADKVKTFADACADGVTAADAQSTIPTFIVAQGASSADGKVTGHADIGAKCDKKDDPASSSFIIGISAQGIGVPFVINQLDGQGAEASGLDATLIGSISGAGGSSGRTSATATGDASASGGFGPEAIGPSSSSGTVSSSATANGGLGLSAAVIGSADYATDTVESDPSLVDVALIGTGAFSAGTAGAHAYANGQTEANGSILHQTIIGDPIYLTELNITSDAFAIGEACSDVSTKNGVALAADAILAGEGTGISFDNGGVSAGETAGSIVGQAAFAQQFGKSGSAKADTFASGEAGTDSSYYLDLGAGRYTSADGMTDASGTVGGNANAGCGDPLSVSAIVAYNDFGGSLDESFAGIGEAYNAALVGSLSASSGKSADTGGSANGTAFAGSTQVLNTTTAGNSLYITNSTSSADATVRTTASTTSDNGFALGVAAQGASSESDSSIDDVDTGGGHAITLDGALTLADDNGKATAYTNMMEQVVKIGSGKKATYQTILVPVEDREATALAQFTVDLDDDFVPDGNFTSTSVSGSHAITSAEAAKGGFGMSLAGEASGSLTDVNSISGTIDQDVFSVIADLAIAETDCSKETAKALAEAGGDTIALNYAQIPGWNGTQSSQAQGDVSAYATASDKCKDPFAASLILALGENEVYPDPVLVYVPAMNTSDSTLIASFSATNGSKGDTGADARGSANANGFQNVPSYLGTPMIPTTNASTKASVWSHAAGNNGLALGIAGVGSSSNAHVDFNLENVSDQNLMFSYAAGQGLGKKATVDACAGYDAADTAASASNVFDRDPDVAKVASNSSVSGNGISTIKASDANLAKGLNFGWAGQNASNDFSVPPADGSHVDAAALFGAEVSATNDAKGTTAYTNMTKVNLSANASAGFADLSIPEESASVLVPDGYASAFLDPDGGPFNNGLFEIEISDPATFQTTGAYTQVGDNPFVDTSSNPNLVYWHAGAAADSDTNIPSFPPIFSIVPNLPPI